jgi:phospholipid/cholesterol/gamma-HCH transport system substrate-binding protein
MSGRVALQIRRYGRYFLILLALVVIGTGAGSYILLKQRLPNPFQSFYSVNAAFPSAAAVVPGLGEPVNVAGVHVGEIVGATLKNGQGVIHMQIDPSKLPGRQLYSDAHADLVPNTPLKDMEVNIAPGNAASGVLPRDATIPVAQTTSPIDADDLLSALDGDTRNWLTSLITELNQGTLGRGKDIRELFMNLGPTSAQLREIGDLLAQRRHELASLVHNLGVLSSAVSQRDGQLRQVVQAGDQAIGALATQNVALQASVTRLPGVLSTTRTTLSDVTSFANQLGPTSTALVPTARRLPSTLRNSQTLFQAAALLPLNEIPSFVNAVTPLAAQLSPLAHALRKAIPALIKSFKVLAYVTNETAYDAGGRNPGFLYWIAWFAHNADSFISNSDANGPAWRVLVLSSCKSLKALPVGPLLQTALGTNFGC